jgi:hypothetical protein
MLLQRRRSSLDSSPPLLRSKTFLIVLSCYPFASLPFFRFNWMQGLRVDVFLKTPLKRCLEKSYGNPYYPPTSSHEDWQLFSRSTKRAVQELISVLITSLPIPE